MRPLPIDALLPEVVTALRGAPALVLRAAPGAGKTTRVPATLLDAGLAGERRVLVLEPRRIAARAAAEFIAGDRGWRLGREVGYRVRFEQCGGKGTRLWFLTEGVLGRQLARDPFLDEAGLVVLDEFHERHLQGDVALAVVRELQASVRPDLKLMIMSATLDTDRLAAYLGGAPVCTAEGRAHPVEIAHAPSADDRPVAGRIATALRTILAEGRDEGDVLVFLPGAAEIARTAEAIAPLAAAHALEVMPLHGNLPLDAQHRALTRGGRRRVVLATNVAETALTIESVTAVIDSGLARIARFDTRRGINALRLIPISRAAADQRAGRAGRTAPGRCLRLWTAAEQAARRAYEVPEILRLDLTATVLEMRAWGLRDVEGLTWLDRPPATASRHAERLLIQLGAVDPSTGAVTPTGRRLLALPVHPRIGRLLLEAERLGCAGGGALLAALASERDLLLERRELGGGNAVPWPDGPSDLLLRAERFLEAAAAGFDDACCRKLGVDPRTARAVERGRRHLGRVLGVAPRGHMEIESEPLLRAVLAGFPDRVVRRRAAGSPRGIMVGSTGVILDRGSVVRDAELFVAVDVDAGGRRRHAEAVVRIASAVRREWLTQLFPEAVRQVRTLELDAPGERVVERTQWRYGDLVLDERTETDVDRDAAGELLAAQARADPGSVVTLDHGAAMILERIRFLQTWMPDADLPADVDGLLRDTVIALCRGRRSFAEIRAADLGGALRGALSHGQRAALDREAPAELQLPSGRRAPLRYERGKPPAVAARIQELFGLTATPRVARGRVPVVIEILAPSQRPVQITDDLQSFWRRTYPEVRKQLRGRYPKHAWPEDPLTAAPTAGARRRRER